MKFNKWNHWLLPPDYTIEEKLLAIHQLEQIYKQFNDPIDQLIIACIFELGYPHSFVARATNKAQSTITLRIKKIQTVLSKSYPQNIKK